MTTPDNLGSTAVPSTSRAGASSPDPSNASLGELFGNVTRDISTLMRQEVALAKAEVKQSATQAGKGAGLFAGAGIAGHFVLLFLSLALWWLLGAWIGDGGDRPALGWSALIVAVIWGAIAAVLAVMGRKETQRAKGIPQTTDTMKKIPDALKGQEHA
jgi:hypothetical protein